MPEYTITGRYQQIHHFRWTGPASNSVAAERYVKAVLMGASEGDEVSQSGLQLTNTYCALQQVKVQEMSGAPAKTTKRTGTVKPEPSHPLYLLHTAWRALSAQERREFLTEMLTPNERRAIVLGFDEEEEG